MSVICFVSYEVYPTTWGGCGVLLHHAAELLLQRGHTVIFLLDVPEDYFRRFDGHDRLSFPNARNCRAYHVDTLCEDFPHPPEQIPGAALWKSLRFAHAYHKLASLEKMDFVEFFEYCGVGYHAMARRLYGEDPDGPVLGVRLHNSIELIDFHGATRCLDKNRYFLYGLERGAIGLAEAVLVPTRTYYERYYKHRYTLAPQRTAVSQSPRLQFPRVTRRPDPAGPFTIIHFGRLFQFKGIDQLIHAAVAVFNERPDLRCRVELIGPDSPESPFGDSYIQYLKSLVPGPMRNRFVFTGHLPHEEVAGRLNSALFAVFPNRLESFCYSLHEVYDAGVPVIINDLPGWADFFEHEKNALVYDGTTRGLIQAMKRMLDDHRLREHLARPYAVADEPLGNFYDEPRRVSGLVDPGGPWQGSFRTLVLVLCPAGRGDCGAVREALDRQTDRCFDTVSLIEGPVQGGQVIWWLGRPWHLRDSQGRPLSVTRLVTTDALVLLGSGDRPDPTWLERCVGALRRRRNMAFAGTWARRNGVVLPSFLDVAPEAYPFDHGSSLTRAVIRTEPGQLIVDLFDPNLGNLGEVGCLWQALRRWGPGCLYPQPLLEVTDDQPGPLDVNLLHYLLARYGGPFADRLTILAGILKDQAVSLDPAAATRSALPPMISVEHKLMLAHELGGRDLMKIALKKLIRRLLLRKPP